MNAIYSLISENLSHLGGPMGTEYTYDNYTKYFTSVEYAKVFAEKDYRKSFRSKKESTLKIQWKKIGKDLCSGDLGFVMYHIKRIKIEI